MSNRNLWGWKKGPEDPRDSQYAFAPRMLAGRMPKNVDLLDMFGGIVLDQGPYGACGPNTAVEITRAKREQEKPGSGFQGSRMYVYNLTNVEMRQTGDNGVINRDMLSALRKYGVCPETLWPYDMEHLLRPIGNDLILEGQKSLIEAYRRVDDGGRKTQDILKAPLAQGEPYVFGFTVYESFEDIGPSGIWKPNPKKERIIGGHDVACIGYDFGLKAFKFLNSWGKDWGKEGCFYMQYSFATSKNTGDHYVIDLVRV